METGPSNPEGFQPEINEVVEAQKEAVKQLSVLIESLGFSESEKMVEAGELLLQADWSLESEADYRKLGEAVVDESKDSLGQIALILQMALVQARAGQIDRALDNFADAIEYADNIMDEELGDEVHAIRKLLGWKKQS